VTSLKIFSDEDDTPAGQSAGNVNVAESDDGDDDDDTDYTGLGFLSGDIFDDILGEDEDQSDKPSRKTPKKKGSVKLPQGVTSESQNEVDGTEASNDDDDDNTEEDDDESGGILDILDGKLLLENEKHECRVTNPVL
jgi:Neuraminidase (sialidase)